MASHKWGAGNEGGRYAERERCRSREDGRYAKYRSITE